MNVIFLKYVIFVSHSNCYCVLQAMVMSVEDYGRDLASVQALQRKQTEVERDMTALQSQLEVGGQGQGGTHWGLVTPYGNKGLGQHWLR